MHHHIKILVPVPVDKKESKELNSDVIFHIISYLAISFGLLKASYTVDLTYYIVSLFMRFLV